MKGPPDSAGRVTDGFNKSCSATKQKEEGQGEAGGIGDLAGMNVVRRNHGTGETEESAIDFIPLVLDRC